MVMQFLLALEQLSLLYQQPGAPAPVVPNQGPASSVSQVGRAHGPGRPYDITSRHSDLKFVEVPHSRRWIDLVDKGWARLIDKLDRCACWPTRPALRQARHGALNRQIDDAILERRA